jgi:hypothetical protein
MIKSILLEIIFFISIFIIPPYMGGIYYFLCGSNHRWEQDWLDNANMELRYLESKTDDPELKKILHYSITKYNRIAPWNVMVMPLVYFNYPGTAGMNVPWCPGITISPNVLLYPKRYGALLLVHESLHDTYFGHAEINLIMARIESI